MANFNSNVRDLRDPANGRDTWDPYEHPQTGLKAAIRNLGRDGKSEPAVGPAPLGPESAVSPDEPATPGAELRRASHGGQGGAIYTLEVSMVCPHCRAEIQTIRVARLMRTQVSFTSTLPRKGYVIACPECDRVLSAELSGMI